MAKSITLKRGLDIQINGAAPVEPPVIVKPATCAIIPDDYPGIVPKVDVKEGDEVLAGVPLFHDKQYPDIRVVSPVAGTVKAVVRGERRKLERIVIEPSANPSEAVEINVSGINDSTRAQQVLLESGMWSLIRQRPYNIVPRPGVAPRDIFITSFDSAPLAPDFEPQMRDGLKEIAAAVRLMAHITNGNIYICAREGSCIQSLPAMDRVEIVTVNGPHPAGLPGIQCANLKPVNKGDIVWTLDVMTLLRIGRLLSTSSIDMTTTLALTGCEVKAPHYIKTTIGADMATLTNAQIADDSRNHRVISGNVLTGRPVDQSEGYLRFPYTQITVIAEGNDYAEFMGWASVSPSKMSVNRSFPGHFLNRKFCPDARLQGGRRAMIMSGVYDKVLPMDVMPEFLVKAILSRNLDRMEQLGIYEVAPEDFALCEYVDPSKLELQKIVQEGLDYVRHELS